MLLVLSLCMIKSQKQSCQMQEYLVLFMISLILCGAVFLVFAISPIEKVPNLLKDKKLQFKWQSLKYLVILFILGYLYYTYQYWQHYAGEDNIDIVVPFIFFFGGIFVYLVGSLASNTAHDLSKMALLERENITDGLMKIYNRRHFDDKLNEEILLASRYSLPLSLLLLDLDNFKRVNDTYGHLVGDAVLQGVAKVIKEVVRDVDIAARYGGEEIAIITPSSNIDQAMVLAQRLRARIEQCDIPIQCSVLQSLKVTVSIGVSTLKVKPNNTCETMIEDADQALYRAKKEGKNLALAAK